AAADADEAKIGRDRDGEAFGHQERDAAQRRETRQRDDEGLDALIGDEPALRRADRGTQEDEPDDREWPGDTGLQQDRGRRIDEGDDGSDREIDAPGGDDESHGGGDDQDRRRLA